MVVCQKKIETLDFYLAHPDTEYFVFDLSHQAPLLMNDARRAGFTFYKGSARNRSKKKQWIQTWTFGRAAPVTLLIELYNHVKIYDYSKFDNYTGEDITEEEMMKVAHEIDTKYRKDNRLPMTGCLIINNVIDSHITEINTKVPEGSFADLYSTALSAAMRGGANAVRIYDKVDFETHIDYHQIYGYVLKTKTFPYGEPEFVEGFHYYPYALYVIDTGRARLKPDGFPVLKSRCGNKMAGEDGEWFDLSFELGCISSVDIKLLLQNYEVEDFWCAETIKFKNTFEGSKYFTKASNDFYESRKNSTGSVSRFYKLLNEYIAGFFERGNHPNAWWRGFDKPTKEEESTVKMTKRNPIVGIFITSYARQMLNDLLHKFPHDKVIGYDTDCVFFAGTKEEVENMPEVMAMMGPEAGQVHYDGVYSDVTHKASKSYSGYDLEKQELFKKASGQSKSGKQKRWNKIYKIYETLEVKNEK